VPFVTPMIDLAAGFLAFQDSRGALLVHEAPEYEYAYHIHAGGRRRVGAGTHRPQPHQRDRHRHGCPGQHQRGAGVALAVVGHDFADGLNSASLMLLDALALLIGVGLTLLFHVPMDLLINLRAFAGLLSTSARAKSRLRRTSTIPRSRRTA
jgi:hypothetical protein